VSGDTLDPVTLARPVHARGVPGRERRPTVNAEWTMATTAARVLATRKDEGEDR